MKRVILLLTIFSTSAFGFDNPYTMRSARGLLMGDAFTAVNDDAFTLFYNPATLGRHKHDFTMYPIIGTAQASADAIFDSDFKDFPNEPVGASNLLLNNPVHASGGTAPGFKLFNFGLSGIISDSYDVLVRNNANPTVDIDLRQDRGIAFGIAFPLGTGRLSKKSVSGSQSSLGVSSKYIERTGVVDQIGLLSPTVLGSLSQNEIEDFAKSLGKVKGQGWGFDAGFEHVIRSGKSQFVLGLAALDITGTDFKVPQNDNKLKVASNRDQVNVGLAFGQDHGYFHYILSSDIRDLNEEMDFGRRLRFGAEIGIPGLSLMGGVNSGYYSYGATVDVYFLKVSAGISQIEAGTKYKQIKSTRAVVLVTLFDFSFDA